MKKHCNCLLFIPILLSLTSMGLPKLERHEHHYEEVIITQPTCTSDGLGYLYCPEDDVSTPTKIIPALGHKEAMKTYLPTCVDEGFDVHYCSRCGIELGKDNIVPAHGHKYSHYHIAPDCTHQGHDESFCVYCGEDEYESYFIPCKGHNWEVLAVHEPTCHEKGYTEYACSECGKTKIGNVEEAKHHSFYEIEYDPTCTEFGRIEKRCRHCNYRLSRQGKPPLGHDYVRHEAVSPTCTNPGSGVFYTCSRCDYNDYESHGIPATGHHYYAITTKPTCEAQGYTTYRCLSCGDIKVSDYVPALGHDIIHHQAVSPTCDKPGHEAYDTCTRCEYSTFEGELPKLGNDHEYVFDHEVVPTTHSYGYSIYKCQICGDFYKTDYVSPIKGFQMLNANEAIGYGRGSASGKGKGWCNDDECYFFLYQGSVLDFPLHENYSFSWNDYMKDMGSYPKQRMNALPMDLLDNLQRQRVVMNQNLSSSLLADAPINVDNDLGESPALSLKGNLRWLWTDYFHEDMPLEWEDANCLNLSKAINELPDLSPEDSLDLFEEGHHYQFVTVGDLDLYIGVKYNINDRSITYAPFTRVNNIHNGIYVDQDAFTGAMPLDILSEVSSILKKPTIYSTNHPIQSYHFEEYMTGGNGNAVVNKTHDFTIAHEDFKNLYEAGYDYSYIVINWKFNNSSFSKTNNIYFSMYYSDSTIFTGLTEGGNNYVTYNQPDTNIHNEFYIVLSTFSSQSQFRLHWARPDALFEYARGVYDVSVDVHIFKENAYLSGDPQTKNICSNFDSSLHYM